MENISNFFTLITGACGGLGNAFCRECAKNNESILLTGTSIDRLKNLKETLEKDFENLNFEIFKCDLSSSEDRHDLIEYILEKDIKINKLINNAGVIIEGDLEKFSDSEIENAVLVNCVGTWI